MSRKKENLEKPQQEGGALSLRADKVVAEDEWVGVEESEKLLSDIKNEKS